MTVDERSSHKTFGMAGMNTRFNLPRTLQATAHLIKLQPGHQQLSYLRLIKLLYIAERELLAEHGMLLTADQPLAMPKGPALAMTLNLVRGKAPPEPQAVWSQFVETVGHDVLLRKDPGHGELTRGIRSKLEEVNARYAELDDWDLVKETHKLPEWERHYEGGSNASVPFGWEEVMAHQGRSAADVEVAQAGEATRQALDEIFGR